MWASSLPECSRWCVTRTSPRRWGQTHGPRPRNIFRGNGTWRAFGITCSGSSASGRGIRGANRGMSEIAKFKTGDVYKDEVQNQWDQDACGSHYVEHAAPDTLEWF